MSEERSFYPRLVLDDADLHVIAAWFQATYHRTPISRIEMVTAFAWNKVLEALIAEAEHRHM